MAEEREWVEIRGSTMRLRDDGRVDCYSESGYRILELGSLPTTTQRMLTNNKVMSSYELFKWLESCPNSDWFQGTSQRRGVTIFFPTSDEDVE
jgi:hypothetical protein